MSNTQSPPSDNEIREHKRNALVKLSKSIDLAIKTYLNEVGLTFPASPITGAPATYNALLEDYKELSKLLSFYVMYWTTRAILRVTRNGLMTNEEVTDYFSEVIYKGNERGETLAAKHHEEQVAHEIEAKKTPC